ncbi:MAG: hypothetical protein IRY90_11710, partial [Actinomadura rubrobrunea]|nr:hypothetical protein [Actinomadura rubrobrunea]
GRQVARTTERAAHDVAALPGRLAKVVSLQRLLRAAPVVVAAGVVIVIGRRLLRKR